MTGPGERPVGRSWGQRLLIAFNLLVITAVVAGAGGAGYLYWQFEHIKRVDLKPGILEETAKGEPENYLLVGTDSRECVHDAADEEAFGGTDASSGSGHSDTTIIVRVDPRTDQAAMVSFPRDLWVKIPGLELAPKNSTHGMQRINVAYLGTEALGIPGPPLTGPELLIETIKQDFDIPINHYAQIDICGLRAMVDAIGGVTVPLDAPVRDWDEIAHQNWTGLDISRTGCVVLNGGDALAFVRSRHFETLQHGHWISDGGSDLQRNARQQDFIRRAANKVMGQVRNPVTLKKLVEAGTKNIQLGTSVKIENLITLAKGFKTLDGDTLGQYAIPVTPDMRGAASVLVFQPGTDLQREAILNVFRGLTSTLVTTTTTTTAAPGGQAGAAPTTLAATTTTAAPAPAC